MASIGNIQMPSTVGVGEIIEEGKIYEALKPLHSRTFALCPKKE
jgi:hypothetical protein